MRGIAAVACLIAVVPSQDVQAVGKRLAAAVKAGELTRDQANAMMSFLRQEQQRPKEVDAKAAETKQVPGVTLDLVPVDGAWLVEVGGRRYPFGKELTAVLGTLARSDLEPGSTPEKPFSGLELLVRAPAETPYGEVQHLIKVCGSMGIYKVELVVKIDLAAKKPKADQPPAAVPADEMRVAIFWDTETKKARRVVGHITIVDDEHLVQMVRDHVVRRMGLDHLPPVVVVDAAEAVPWSEVMNVVDIARAEGVKHIEFAAGKRHVDK